MQTRMNIYATRIGHNIKKNNKEFNIDALLFNLNKEIKARIQKKNSCSDFELKDMRIHPDLESQNLTNSIKLKNFRGSVSSISTHYFQQLSDNDYRDILEILDKKFHSELYSLGIKTVSKYSLYGNERATEKIFALQDFYYKKVLSYKYDRENLGKINDAVDFYRNLFSSNLLIIKKQNKTFSNIRRFLIDSLNDIEFKGNLFKLLQCDDLHSFDKIQIIDLVLKARKFLTSELVNIGRNYFDGLDDFVGYYLQHSNKFEGLDTIKHINQEVYNYIINIDIKINRMSQDMINFIYKYEKQLVPQTYELFKYIIIHVIQNIKNTAGKQANHILNITDGDNNIQELLALKLLLSPDKLDSNIKQKAMIILLNILKSMNEMIPQHSLIRGHKYSKLIHVLYKNDIKNTDGLNNFIKSIGEINKLKESIEDLSIQEKQIQDICNKLLETINKKESLVDQESQLDKEIDQVIERKLDIVSNGLGKTESLILKENEIINVRQQLDERARSVDNSMKGIYTDLNLRDSYVEVLNDQNSDIQKNIITNRINQKLGVLITEKNNLIKQLNEFAEKLKIDTSDIDGINQLIKDFILNA